MKKIGAWILVLVCIVCLFGCSKSTESEYPYYFIGEIVGEHEWGGIVKVVDYGNHKFNSKEVIMHEVKLGQDYCVGDYIRVEFSGLFLETSTPQIKAAISIEKTEAP